MKLRLRFHRLFAPVAAQLDRTPLARLFSSRYFLPAVGIFTFAAFLMAVSGNVANILNADRDFKAGYFFDADVLSSLINRIVPFLLFTIGALAFLFYIPAAFAATSRRSAAHKSDTSALLDRAAALLESNGFTVRRRTAALTASRQGNALAESPWREFPVVLRLAAHADKEDVRLTARVTAGTTPYAPVRRLLSDTAAALVCLDEPALVRASTTRVPRQGLLTSGLARPIFRALLFSVAGTFLVFSALIGFASVRWIQLARASENMGAAMNQAYALRRAVEKPWRDRIAALENHWDPTHSGRRTKLSRSPADVEARRREFLDEFRATGFVVAHIMPDGRAELLLPTPDDPLRAIAQTVGDTGPVSALFTRASDRVFAKVRDEVADRALVAIGFPKDNLVLGVLLTWDELTRVADPVIDRNADAVYFGRGRSVARFRWTANGGVAEPANVPLPKLPEHPLDDDVDSPFAWRDLLSAPHWTESVRFENRGDRTIYSALYGVVSPAGGFSGLYYTRPPQRGQTTGMVEFLILQSALAFGAFWISLLVAAFVAMRISVRLSSPVLEVRDALQLIAQGDYSVHLDSVRRDEIGQLQKLVGYTAEELRKRETMRNLFGKYLSQQVADRVMEAGDEPLTGVRREVSVLFADVRGFTSYSEKNDPEHITRTLNEYFDVMVDVISAHEGVLDKYLGDGLMVVFGAPMAQHDHAWRAVVTALEMQAALQSLNLRRVQRGDQPIAIGIGVNTGPAVSGNLGSIKRMEFTVIGDTVNLAARLESRALQGQILIGRGTWEKVHERVHAESMGALTVKGKSDAVEVWQVSGLIA